MTDCVAIASELPFRAQVVELATHLSRCVPASSDAAASKELIAGYEGQLKEGEEEDEEKRKEIIKGIATKVGEVGGALDGVKESDVESSHLLLQYVLSTTFKGEEYEQVFKIVLEGLRKGVETYAASGRLTRLEVAARILNNTYNSLPPTSPLRPATLLLLLTTLSKFTDLSILPLTPNQLSQSVESWSIPTSEKVDFLSSASDIYRSTSSYSTSYDILLIALRYEARPEIVEKAAVVAVLDEKRFNVEELVSNSALNGEAKELIGLLSSQEAVGAVGKGEEWVGKNESWIKARGISQFTPSLILRKLRLLSLAEICSKSSTRQLSYEEISTALRIETQEVESWIFEAIRSKLIQARINQPSQSIRIISVSSAADRVFGDEKWELLAKRLGEWKVAVESARKTVGEAEELARAGPATQGAQGQGQQGRRYGGQSQGGKEGKEGYQAQGQSQREEVLA